MLTQKQLRLTPTLSNCDALLSMLANASLISVCLAANNRCKTACMLAKARSAVLLGWDG
ncbi:hypothetical protein ACOWOS_07965 [Helicobacter pylori]